MALGGSDRRVPMNIGREFIRLVKQHNNDVMYILDRSLIFRVLHYPDDNHNLRSFVATLDGYSLFAKFMDQHS